MSETIYKFQPDRTFYLRGFDGRGACAALHSASASGFTVSGVFRDASDFAVLVIYDVDDFYNHPSFKPLPAFSLADMVLEFDAHYSGLHTIDSIFYPTIDWPYLDVILADGSTTQIKLIDYATPVGAGLQAASCQLLLSADGAEAGDTLRLWFQNINWNYTWAGDEELSAVGDYFAAQINATDWASGVGGSWTLSATNTDGLLTITASPAGSDGNTLTMYSVASNPSGFTTIPTVAQFSGGSSDVTWHVTLNFTELGIDTMRQAWLTFAPALAYGTAYTSTNWDAVFTNWGITSDPNNISALQIAGPGSVRVEESDAWCSYSGSSWAPTDVGWFSKGFAQVADDAGDSVTITYWCQFPHDLWLGTSVYLDRGIFDVTVDGTAQPPLDMYLANTNDVAISTRRQLATGIAAGKHTVVLTVAAAANPASEGNYCYFDFLEAAVATADLPAAPGPFTDRNPAIDYDTNHGYQLAPARLLWMFERLGFAAAGSPPIDEYIGVFWWNQRKVTGQTLASVTVTFSGSFVEDDQIFLVIGGETIGKTVFDDETAATWAAHFAYFINETFSGVWAQVVDGDTLQITVRSEDAAYQVSFTAYVESDAGAVHWSGSLEGSTAGTWVVDPTQSPALNYGAVAWHSDLYALAAANGLSIVSAFSMELVDTPDDPPDHVWVARFPDGTPVLTATGFGDLNSAQCVPMAPEFLAYQQVAYLHVAQLQAAAGLSPQLQFGEFLWWYFDDASGMAYYDDTTSAAALYQLSRALHTFLTPNDDPSVNAYADANFLAARLNAHVAAIASYVQAAVPGTLFEILFPNDVNNAIVSPITKVGGLLNAYVNFPSEWKSSTTAPFERFKLEQLAYGTTDRNLDMVKAGLAQIAALSWSADLLRYLYPVDNPGVPQWSEHAAAKAAGFVSLTPWAFDHINLLNWPVEPPSAQSGAQRL